MTLQDVFYIVGIIFLSIYSIILIGLIISAFYLKTQITNKIQNIKQKIKNKITDTKDSLIQPDQIARLAGMAIARTLLKKFGI